MKDWRLALALLLPLAGLAAGIVRDEIDLRDTRTWVIPVGGYDPRDPLFGHYVRFRYLWKVEGDGASCDLARCLICLERRGAIVAARIVPRDAPGLCPDRVDPIASHISADFSSRIFVSESSAPDLTAALTRGPVDMIARLGRDGRLIDERLQPRTASAAR